MSKEKINAAEIVELLAQQSGVSKKMADDFVKALFATVEETLMSQESVKINGLGTFKLQWNEPRKSVDVNTGAEIIIDGYHKVVFTPEAELKELANEPYAHLEPVPLDDEETDMQAKPADELTDSNQPPLKHFNEQASEIKDLLSEIHALGNKQEQHEEQGQQTQEVQPEVVEEQQDKEETEQPEIKSEIVELKADDSVNAENEDQDEKQDDEQIAEPAPVQIREKRVKVPENFYPENTRRFTTTRKPGHKLDFLFIGIMLGGLLVYILIDFDVFTSISKYIESNRYRSEVVREPQYQYVIPGYMPDEHVMMDTLIAEPEVVEPEVSQSEALPEKISSQDELELLFDQPRVYKEFIATEKVIPGSRLTRIAERHYGVKEFWVYIFEANRDLLVSPDDISPGMELKIPKLNPKLADPDNPRCMEYALKLHDEYVKAK